MSNIKTGIFYNSMVKPFHSSFLTKFMEIVTLIICFIVACFIFGSYGKLKLTYDSYDYLASSQSFETYFKGKNPDGFSFMSHAPFLPAYLHFFNDKILANWWLNLLSYFVSLFLIFNIGRAMDLRGFFLYAPVAVSAVSYPWLQNHFFLWTEPVFSVFLLLLFFCLLRKKPFFLVIVLCILLFLVRKAGIFFFAGTATWFLLKRDYKHFIISGLVMIIIFVGWQLIELHFTNASPSLENVRALVSFSKVHYVDALSAWLLPRFIPLYFRLMLSGILILSTALFFRKPLTEFYQKEKNQLLITLVAVYLVSFITLFGALEYLDGERYLSILLPVCMLLLFSFCQEISSAYYLKRKIFWVCLGAWLLYPLTRTIYHFYL